MISFKIEMIYFFYNINTKYFKAYGTMMIMNVSFTLKSDEEHNKKRNPKHIYISSICIEGIMMSLNSIVF